jgi:RHS repeat-associated protein
VCEERNADGTTVTRRSFPFGEQASGEQRYFAADHLRSVTEVTDSSATVLARYAFDPWGRRTLTAGSDLTVVGFTGHRWHASDSLWLTLYREYDADAGRWLSPDPIGMAGGINLYAYAADAPVRFVDPLGLKVTCSSSIDYQYDVKQTRCGSAGCTWASMGAPDATPCKEECGKWKFNGTVKLKILVQYAVDPKLPSSDTPGATLAEHEALHVGDWQQWCGGLESKYPSEGFSSKPACDRARNNFLKGVPLDFLTNLESTRRHDAK